MYLTFRHVTYSLPTEHHVYRFCLAVRYGYVDLLAAWIVRDVSA
jgi:hypothetical protein